VPAFGALVKGLRLRAGFSMNDLARRTRIDPAYLHRIEHAPADRPVVPGRRIVVALCEALGLERRHLDDLLARAGYCPESVAELGGWDSALAEVAEVLGNRALPAEDKAEFREVLRLVAHRWRAASEAP
jgi:transcriptional regulator with XRE-family HTH domain